MTGLHRCFALILMVCASAGAHASTPSTLLAELFQDHAVLQRDRPIPIWGTARANDEVTVSFNGQKVTVRSDGSGRWTAELPAMPAGGPFELTAQTSSGVEHTIFDVLVGDVWLCSGQSNMEMQVNRALNSFTEIRLAANDSIRLLTVSQDTSVVPLRKFVRPVRWQAATSESVADFSATCFYFARELQKHVDVPMGLIHASWGGSKIEPWMSTEALQAAGGYEDMLEILELKHEQPAIGVRRWADVWEQWWHSRVPDEAPWRDVKQGEWVQAPAALTHWEGWGVPALEKFNGMVWFRANVELTAQQVRQGATLELGKIDDVDIAWVNGQSVGSTAGPNTDREYPVAKGVLKAGANTIVMNALDLWGSGGPYGATPRALRLQDGTSISLEGRWQYRIVPKSIGEPPRAPWDTTAGLTLIGNAMIAPLGNYRMRGVVWYQGESNTDAPERYEGLLVQWMADWRERFGEDASFLIVQLANFGPPPTAPTESGWAGVREAQRRAVANDENAGLAVAIDLGDRWDIHPANKQQVGYRLARAARHVIYGEAITPSGPVPVNARREGDDIVVTFTDVEESLVAYSGENPVGFELCAQQTGSCRYALATLEGSDVRLSASNADAASRVRFCWADSPVCTLFDGAGLPAGPFEIAIE